MPIDDGLEFGDTDAGFVVPAYEATQDWVGRRLRQRRGANIVLTPKSFWGAVRDMMSDALNLAFQISGAAHDMNTFSFARGVNLDRILEPLGTQRKAATFSTVTLALYGTAGTNIPAGSTVRSSQVTTPFQTLALATIPASPSALWVIEIAPGFPASTTFTLTIGALPPLVKVSGALDSPATIATHFVAAVDALAQVAASSGGAAGGRSAVVIADDGIGPFALTFGTNGPAVAFAFTAVHAAAQAMVTGPVLAQAATLRQILTPIPGWQGVTNELDAALGSDQETDAALRARHRDEIMAVSGSNPAAIRARVLKYGGGTVEGGVTYCRVQFNKSDIFVNGLKPHSIRVIIERKAGVTNDSIAQAIFDAKSAGDDTNGALQGTALDTEGDPQIMDFDEVQKVYLWVKVFVVPGEKFPVIGDPYAAIRDDIVAFGNLLGVGFDVDPFALPINHYPDGTDRGVKSAEVYLAMTATELPAPNFPGDYLAEGASAVIDDDERAVFDTSRTDVQPLA